MNSPVISFPIVDENGYATDAFRQWMADVMLGTPIIGNVAPEFNVEAQRFQLYIDRNGGPTTMLYIKRLDQVGGDPKRGWVAI